IQASLDELARMREAVANGRRVAPARPMIARIQALTRPGGAAAVEAEAPKPPAPAPAVAPAAPAAPATPATSATPVAATAPIESLAPLSPPDVGIPQPEPAEEAAPDAPASESIELATEMPEPPMLAAAAEPQAQPPPEEEAAPGPILSSAPPPAAEEPELAAPDEAVPAESSAAESPADEVLAAPQPVPPGREPVAPVERQEMARVDAELLDKLLNISGEASIARSRLEEQLRSLEIETEAQILHRHEDDSGHRSVFDPLELDRYSSIQQFSRALAETANDVASIQQLLENQAKDTQTLLQQQARTITELQNGLMRTRMVPFQRHVQRLARIVRQAASDTGKRAELV